MDNVQVAYDELLDLAEVVAEKNGGMIQAREVGEYLAGALALLKNEMDKRAKLEEKLAAAAKNLKGEAERGAEKRKEQEQTGAKVLNVIKRVKQSSKEEEEKEKERRDRIKRLIGNG